MRWLLLASICLIALVSACSDDDEKPVASRWDAGTVWQYRTDASAWQACNVQTAAMLRGDEPCIVDVMKQAGASRSAIDFSSAKKYFLASFQEKGKVDYGQGGAPWINMGRPTPQLFLNGSPDIIEATIPQDWKQNPSYAGLLAREPTVFHWLEYGTLASATEAKGAQTFVIDYPLRVCRACPDLALMPVTYAFDAKGVLGTTSVGALKPK